MGHVTISNIKGNALIIGAAYDKIDKLNEIINKEDHEYTIINGNVLYPLANILSMKKRIEDINKITSSRVIYVSGRRDFEAIKSLNDENISKWVLSHPNIVFLRFKNGSKIIVMDGGVTPEMNTKDIQNSLEISFVSKIDSIPWHRYYNGRFGYIISNRPESNNIKCYGYSAHIGTEYENNKIFTVEVNKFGIKKSTTYEW